VQLSINPSDDLAIYRQIMRQITDAIAGGRLKAGEKLTSHRELSEQLVVAPLTVKRAYDELEALGYIETQRGRGTFVCNELPEPDAEAQSARLHAAARALLAQAYLAGLRFSDVQTLLKAANHELVEGPAAPRSRRTKSA
jgi:GntR family transcriptional regulator